MRHGRGIDEHPFDRRIRELRIHPALQPAVVEIAERQRLSGTQPQQRLQSGAPRVQRETGQIGAHRLQRRQMLPVGWVVDEAAEMHPMGLREMTEHVPGANFLPCRGGTARDATGTADRASPFTPIRARSAARPDWRPAKAALPGGDEQPVFRVERIVVRDGGAGGELVAVMQRRRGEPQLCLNACAPVPTLLRPKSNSRKPRSAARRITSQYMKSFPARCRASAVPPP